jgi:hypothetical protein
MNRPEFDDFLVVVHNAHDIPPSVKKPAAIISA